MLLFYALALILAIPTYGISLIVAGFFYYRRKSAIDLLHWAIQKAARTNEVFEIPRSSRSSVKAAFKKWGCAEIEVEDYSSFTSISGDVMIPGTDAIFFAQVQINETRMSVSANNTQAAAEKHVREFSERVRAEMQSNSPK